MALIFLVLVFQNIADLIAPNLPAVEKQKQRCILSMVLYKYYMVKEKNMAE